MGQSWFDLLFAHWRVDAEELRRVLPPHLEPDRIDGSAAEPFGIGLDRELLLHLAAPQDVVVWPHGAGRGAGALEAKRYRGSMPPASPDIVAEVASWPEVELQEGRFGSTRFVVGRRELGHLHGSSTLDLPLPKRLKAELIARGEAEPHRFTPPGSGWVTIRLRSAEDSERALGILRERYEHALSLRRGRAAAPPAA